MLCKIINYHFHTSLYRVVENIPAHQNCVWLIMFVWLFSADIKKNSLIFQLKLLGQTRSVNFECIAFQHCFWKFIDNNNFDCSYKRLLNTRIHTKDENNVCVRTSINGMRDKAKSVPSAKIYGFFFLCLFLKLNFIVGQTLSTKPSSVVERKQISEIL